MAKYDGITQALGFTCTIEARNLPTTLSLADFEVVSVGCVLGSATAAFITTVGGAPRVPGHTLEDRWYGVYHKFTVSAHAGPVIGGDTETLDYYVWTGDVFVFEHPTPDPTSGVIQTGDLSVDVTIGVTGLFLQGAATDDTPTDRGFLWFGDRTFAESWRADGAQATVTAGTASAYAAVDDDLDYDLGTNLGVAIAISCSKFTAQDTVYAAVVSPSFSAIDIDLSTFDLYNPGLDIPDAINAPSWGRTENGANRARLSDVGGMAMYHEGSGSGAASWLGTIGVPFHANFVPDDGQFSRDLSGSDMDYIGVPIEWYYEDATWKSRQITWNTPLEVINQNTSWEFAWEGQEMSSTNVWVNVDEDYREDNDEDVGVAADNQDDVACPIVIHPRDSSSLEGDPYNKWGLFFSFAHEGELPVCKPSGVTRPANWNGSGGLTPKSTTGILNDSWDIAAGSVAPKATFSLPTRYWTRLDRLADRGADINYHSVFFPYLNRPNVDSWAGDDLDPVEARIPEAEWHWRNHSHLELKFSSAPRDIDVTVTVNYYTVYIDDPCYTDFTHRYGTEGEFYYTRSMKAAVYNATITSGLATIDLVVPVVGEIVPELHVVDSIEITFDEAVADETWILDDLYLVLDKTPGATSHFNARMYDPYDWLTDYTMFAARVDGCPVFDIPYGYEFYQGTERSLKGRQKRRHPPDSEAEGILDYAKVLSVLSGEVDLQRGWNGSLPSPVPEESDQNKDDEDNYVVGTFRWFDLKQCSEESSLGFPGGPVVRTYQLACGVKHDLYHPKFPQGKVHGLVYAEDRSSRTRSGATIYLLKRIPSETEWTVVEGPIEVDVFGRFKCSPQKERQFSSGEDWLYGVIREAVGIPEESSTLDNRRYWWAPLESSGLLAICVDHKGTVFRAGTTSGTLTIQKKEPFDTGDWSDNIGTVEEASAPSDLSLEYDDEDLLLFWVSGGNYHMLISKDEGITWREPWQ